LSTKIHAGCIDEQTGVALVLTEGQRHESPVFEAVFAQLPEEHHLTHAIMDKAYDSDQIRAQLTGHDLVPVIPPKSNRLAHIDYDRDLYRLREKVERFFNKLKQFRRIATRYEKLSHTFLAFIHLVAAWISIQ
jgi:putative transposase